MVGINREAGDKQKGFALQKLRAISLIFKTLNANPNAQILSAIEHEGDVFLFDGKIFKVEEDKNYDSKNFTFASPQVLNTLVYFLDYWLKSYKSKNIKFSFYATNEIAKEQNSATTKSLGITLPDDPILQLLSSGKFSEHYLLDSVKKFVVEEYKDQYSKKLSESNHAIISAFNDTDWIEFLGLIEWSFSQPDERELDEIIKSQIGAHPLCISLKFNSYKIACVKAFLKEEFEFKQTEKDPIFRYVSKDRVENIIHQTNLGNISNEVFKHLEVDVLELQQKTKAYLANFLKRKYNATVVARPFPELIKRLVAKHSNEVRIDRRSIEQSDPEKAKRLEVIIKELGDFINSSKPTFLFGEIGSGKSTLLAHYIHEEIGKSLQVAIFIPAYYLKGRIPIEVAEFRSLVEKFVSDELGITDRSFSLNAILMTKVEATLAIDGIDEFEKEEARRLLQHLLHLSSTNSNLRVIATGRPIELQDIVAFNDWNCLTTLELTSEEVQVILLNEAIAEGLASKEAKEDADKRYKILYDRQELFAIATTPLVVCLLRDFLDMSIAAKTLGELLYEVLKNKLEWHSADQKESLKKFLQQFPNSMQREKFVAAIADKIYNSSDGKISEGSLFQIIDSEFLIPKNLIDRNNIVDEAIKFFKNNFLQKMGEHFVFSSHQLYQVAVGLNIFNKVYSEGSFKSKNSIVDEWREFSYAGAIARVKGESAKLEAYYVALLNSLLVSTNYTAASSVLLSEVKIQSLNDLFFSKVKAFGFRPLKFWGESNTMVPNAYAYIIDSLKGTGFEWFFEEYLNPIHPSPLGWDRMGVLILRSFFIQHEFSLKQPEKEKLKSIINYHITARTFSCSSLLPTIALAIPEAFSLKERCILLAEMVNSNMVSFHAEKLLTKESANGNQQDVLNALELVCTKEDKRRNVPLLWLKLSNKSTPIPKLILEKCINLIAKDDVEVENLVYERVTKSNLAAYLKFCVLYRNHISDDAAIQLFKTSSERNFTLIGEPIIHKTTWFDYKDYRREKILAEIIDANGNQGYRYLINNIPNVTEQHGIPELYLKFFCLASKEVKILL